jgi:regulator of cell morphogenesis and NO signaling
VKLPAVNVLCNEGIMEVQTDPGNTTDWNTADLPSLIQHILLNFHKPLQDALPRLESMLAKVTEEHLEKDARLSELRSTFGAMKAELESHMMKEEQILFPMILSAQGAFAGGPISVMEQEHDSANAALKKIRELTDGFQALTNGLSTSPVVLLPTRRAGRRGSWLRAP